MVTLPVRVIGPFPVEDLSLWRDREEHVRSRLDSAAFFNSLPAPRRLWFFCLSSTERRLAAKGSRD